MSVDSGAGSSGVGSTGSLSGPSTPAAVFSTPKLQPTSGILINLSASAGPKGTSTGSGSPGSADSALTASSQGHGSVEQALADIHITENPISQSSQGQVETDASYNPKC